MDNDSEILRDIEDIIKTNTIAQMPQDHQTNHPNQHQQIHQSHITHLPQSSSSPAFVNIPQIPMPQEAPLQNDPTKTIQKPYIEIIEQPTSKAFRFRYQCEGRSAGSIPGENSTNEKKTYPTIEIKGWKGEVAIVVSCVTKDEPYLAHPHKLVGKDGCKHGVCTLPLKGEPLRLVFSNLGIQCVRKKDIQDSLLERQAKKIDPFRNKFDHMNQPSSIDLNAVRLCFQAFLITEKGHQALEPVVSNPIFKKPTELVITRLCSCSAKVGGGDEIILLCDKIVRDDIKIRFYEIEKDKVTWKAYAEFNQHDVHKQTAIAFRTPRYHSTTINGNAKVYIQLVRPSDGMTSEPKEFEYYPDPDELKRKRISSPDANFNILRSKLQNRGQTPNQQFQNDFSNIFASSLQYTGQQYLAEVKPEPVFLGVETQNGNSNDSTMTSIMPKNFMDVLQSVTSTSGGTLTPLANLQQANASNLAQQPMHQQQMNITDNLMTNQFINHLPSMPNFIGAASYTPLEQQQQNIQQIQQHQQLSPVNNINMTPTPVFRDYQSPPLPHQSMSPEHNYIQWPTNINTTNILNGHPQNVNGIDMNMSPNEYDMNMNTNINANTNTNANGNVDCHDVRGQAQPQYTNLQQVSEVLPNFSAADGPTLSGLLATIDFDDLPLSNLSIHERTPVPGNSNDLLRNSG